MTNTTQSAITSEAQAKAALKVFFCAVAEWDLSADEARRLLGDPSQSQYDQYKSGIVHSVSDDFLLRLACLSTIYGKLRQLYSEQNIRLWLKNGSEPGSKWCGLSPLEYMLSSIRGVIAVFDHLNAYTS